MSYFNKVFTDELNKNKLNINENFKGAFGFEQKNAKKGIEEFWKKLYAIIYEPINKNDVEKSAKEENITITITAGLFDFEHTKTSTKTYNLAILQNYGAQKSKNQSIDDLISGFKGGKIPKDKQEGISLLIGINNGYQSFRAEQKFVKFKMDSLLDYYTIESIFQHAINEKENCSSFDYIEKIAPKKQKNNSINLDNNKILYHILDEAVHQNKTYFDEYLQCFKDNQDNMGLKQNLKNILQKTMHYANEYLKKILDLEEKIKELKNENEKLKNEKKDLQNENEKLKKDISKLKNEEKSKTIVEEEIKSLENKSEEKLQISEQINDSKSDDEQNFEKNKVSKDDKKEEKVDSVSLNSKNPEKEQNSTQDNIAPGKQESKINDKKNEAQKNYKKEEKKDKIKIKEAQNTLFPNIASTPDKNDDN